MGSVPKPASLEIKGLDNEMAVASSAPDRLLVGVYIQWRGADQTPALLSILSDIPLAPNDHDLEVMRRDDGSYTLIPKLIMHYVKSSTGASLYDLARQGGFVVGSDYFEYGSDIIKQYQPDFDYSASEEHALLLLHTLERINKVRESIQDLQNFLRYSTPENHKRAVPPIKAPQRDVKAAVLQDVYGLNTFEIGETLGFEGPSDLDKKRKREHATVRLAAQRGRELLRYYFGVEEWKQKAERMRALRARWLKLDGQPKKQLYLQLAEHKGTSLEVEEAAAIQDGFDQLLEECIAALLRGDVRAAIRLMSKDPRFKQFTLHL
jgi:hypothetical protein